MSSPSTLAPPPERRVEIETPEHVMVGYALADLGSRFVALVLDVLLLMALLGVLLIGVPLLASRVLHVPEVAGNWSWAVLGLLAFATAWGYFVYFEGLRDGQTPGKRAMRIRAVHDGGHPLTVRGAAVRNLLRVIDVQPLPSWLVGGVSMLLHPETKRLGDMAAGTVVVRERAAAQLPEEALTASGGAGDGVPAAVPGAPRLEPAEYAALAKFVERRRALQPAVRERIAGDLLARLLRRVENDPRRMRMSADEFLAVLHAEESARVAGAARKLGSPQATALLRERRPQWQEYLRLLERAGRRGLARMGEDEVARFATHYRALTADLARARTYGASQELVYTLERWVGAGHNLLYRPAERSWRLLWRWLAGGFPRLVRQRWRVITLASALLYLPALLAFAAVRLDPPRARELVPAQAIARAEEAGERRAVGKGYVDVPEVFMPMMASGIIANNVQVTFIAFAGGIVAGLGTLAVLVFNGVHLGSVAALFANHGASMHLWEFVLPHGIIELTAICIAGGAGLWLGSALLLPGRRTRREVLVARGREAVSLLGGTVAMLLVAGSIEGFVSPSALPRPAKLLFALLMALLLASYLLLAGRRKGNYEF